MNQTFFDQPILNSPYSYPKSHWELDDKGLPTHHVKNYRRGAKYIAPIPQVKKRGSQNTEQDELLLDEGLGLSNQKQQYEMTAAKIDKLRSLVDQWRLIPHPNQWHVTPETARLLQYWRCHNFQSIRPFFCQIEAVEVAIWLTEVAPSIREGKEFIEYLKDANEDANPELNRLALKLATGAGKTTVMAMLIVWQTINAVRRPTSSRFTRGFLVVTPGLTIKDRLRVLQPNDLDSYYRTRELAPADMLPDLNKARIVITNYHAFKLQQVIEVSKGTQNLIQGRTGEPIATIETEGAMLARVMPELMSMKNIMVLNDEAHHCYRERPTKPEDEVLKGEEKDEADKNNIAARLWITGLEIVKRKLGISRVMDLSATPFFLKGSGYAEGTVFPWTLSDFSLMDAIECGIVKLPRVPIADNVPGNEMPMYRNLWEHVKSGLPKKGRSKSKTLDPLSLPTPLITAIEALYGHYAKTFALWKEEGISVPPCFIFVCNNTATSKLVYEYISGFADEAGNQQLGHCELFRNTDEHGNPMSRPHTILVDSEQLESGDALDAGFRAMAADEIERFRKEIIARTGDVDKANNITDAELLREVMNTVGKAGRLGANVRCVVSVSMLTEGWDANTVTHVLGVRAFGTQLLCEQVIGRALRRQSYDINETTGLFNVEYADILGIPFDFTAEPVTSAPQKPRETVHVHAVSPDRDHLEIRFPNVKGYRIDHPNEKLEAEFNNDSTLYLTPALIGATETKNAGIIGKEIDLSLAHTKDVRPSTVIFELATHFMTHKWRASEDEEKFSSFGDIKRIVKQWVDNHLVCQGGTYPAQLKYKTIADQACERIAAAIVRKYLDAQPVKAILDPYIPEGSTRQVSFNTTKTSRWQTDPRKCHINWVVCDSDWEAEFCRIAEKHPKVIAYVKNHGLNFDVPYLSGSENRIYRPDFILKIDDGNGPDNLLNLVVEIKGYRGENAKEKKNTMETHWVPGVNSLGTLGRWDFVEFTEIYAMESDFSKKIEDAFNSLVIQKVQS